MHMKQRNTVLNEILVQNKTRKARRNEQLVNLRHVQTATELPVSDREEDYEDFLSKIENLNNEYKWSRYAQEILARSGRAAKFIGHKIEKRIIYHNVNHNQSVNYNKLALSHLLSLTSPPPSVTTHPLFVRRSRGSNSIRAKLFPVSQDIINHEQLDRSENGEHYSNQLLTIHNIIQTNVEQIDISSKNGEAKKHLQYINFPSNMRAHRGISEAKHSSGSRHFRRRDVDTWGLERHRIECWASNEVGASVQPCVFLVSKVGKRNINDCTLVFHSLCCRNHHLILLFNSVRKKCNYK